MFARDIPILCINHDIAGVVSPNDVFPPPKSNVPAAFIDKSKLVVANDAESMFGQYYRDRLIGG